MQQFDSPMQTFSVGISAKDDRKRSCWMRLISLSHKAVSRSHRWEKDIIATAERLIYSVAIRGRFSGSVTLMNPAFKRLLDV